MTAHEKAVLTYQILQRRKKSRIAGEVAADNFRFEGRDKQRKATRRKRGY